MKKILLLVFILLISGCNYHAFDFDATSNADCAFKCERLMNNYSCWESAPTYESSFTNGEQIKGECSCYIRNCIK